MVGEETEVLEFLSLKQKKLELDPNIKHFNYLNIGEEQTAVDTTLVLENDTLGEMFTCSQEEVHNTLGEVIVNHSDAASHISHLPDATLVLENDTLG